jgi:hypothetical protein
VCGCFHKTIHPGENIKLITMMKQFSHPNFFGSVGNNCDSTYAALGLCNWHSTPLSTETTYLFGAFGPEVLSLPLTPAPSGLMALL